MTINDLLSRITANAMSPQKTANFNTIYTLLYTLTLYVIYFIFKEIIINVFTLWLSYSSYNSNCILNVFTLWS